MSPATTGVDDVLVRRAGTLGRLTLNRPAVLNALTPGMVAAMTAAILAWEDDPDVSAIVLDRRAAIDRCFGFDAVEEVVAALEREGDAWSAATLAVLRSRSPTSLKITLAALRAARDLPDLEACLRLEVRLVCRILDGVDVFEGVRAAVIDKDRRSRWNSDRIEDVAPDVVRAYLDPRDAPDVAFLARPADRRGARRGRGSGRAGRANRRGWSMRRAMMIEGMMNVPRRAGALLAIGATVALGLAGPARAEGPRLVTEEMMVPSGDPGIELYVRNKRPADLTQFRPERTVLFVHGSTYPAETAFDLALDGQSWMDYIASRGYDVYLVDVRGYGRSTRPPEMDRPPEEGAPVARTETAARDVGSAVDFILKRRNLARLDLLGWSWGTSIMASYAAGHADKVERLVLYAPQWIRTTPSGVQTGPGPIGAYRSVAQDQAKGRWLNGVPEDKKAALIPAGWFEKWADATWATDPKSGSTNPPRLRAPNGTAADTADYWAAGKPLYDPAKLTMPVLLIAAEWDHDTPAYMRQALFPLLVNSPGKRYVELSEGTHSIIMERNRLDLFKAVQAFLDEVGS